MYQLIESLQMAQEMLAGKSLPFEFNEAVIGKLGPEAQGELQKAINDLESEETNPFLKMLAMAIISSVSKHAEDLKTFNEISHKWLNDEQYEAGVDEKGGIILWDKENPTSKIAMAPPKP